MSHQINQLLGLAALVTAVAIFTGGFVSGRMYYDVGGAPPDVVALRYGVAAVFTLPVFLLGMRRVAHDPGWSRCMGLALLGGAPFGLCVLTGVAGAPVAHGAGIVPAMALIQGTVLSYVFLQEPVNRLRLFGLAVALAGLVVLVIPELRSGEATWWGELSYAAAGLLWGSFTVALRAWRIRPFDGAMFAAIFSLPYLPLYAVYLSPNFADVALMQTVLHGAYQGIVFNVFAVMLYGWGIGRLGAIAAVATMPLMPVFGALMEWFILERTPHPFVWIAITLITTGVAVAVLAMRSRPKAATV